MATMNRLEKRFEIRVRQPSGVRVHPHGEPLVGHVVSVALQGLIVRPRGMEAAEACVVLCHLLAGLGVVQPAAFRSSASCAAGA